jgi:hypothetical protein
MKLRPDLDISILKEYGFEEITEDYVVDHSDELEDFVGYAYDMGHARRGQFYYIICHPEEKQFSIYASKPDGSGTSIDIDDIFIKLIKDNIVTL